MRQGLDPKQEQELQKIREQQKREAELSTLNRKKKENITLAEYWPQYLDTAQHKKGTPTLLKEKSHFAKWLSPNLEHIPLKEFDLDSWDFLVTLLKKSGLAPRTREYICLALRQVLNHAFARKIVPSAPPSSKVIGATTNGKDNRRTRILTDKELCNILKELQKRSIPDYNFTLFCILTGCRASEAFKLKWSNVDLDKHEVTFHRTKNSESRKMPLSGTLVELLKNIPMNDPNDHVFIATQGMPYSEIPSSFRKIVAEEGRSPHDRIVFHSLRHTAATKWGRSNIPLRDLIVRVST
ncbi:tyrosine-type recombinase/integrase [Halodesulfovibrio aestuarii]|uniref:Tyrosine-type recombinase/integrase n=1 Tax=Halodesulfovibrio aestuarii TaxID=126333 RepID=A0ABV4JRN6_9BACT